MPPRPGVRLRAVTLMSPLPLPAKCRAATSATLKHMSLGSQNMVG